MTTLRHDHRLCPDGCRLLDDASYQHRARRFVARRPVERGGVARIGRDGPVELQFVENPRERADRILEQCRIHRVHEDDDIRSRFV
jgi:hypothetical protein